LKQPSKVNNDLLEKNPIQPAKAQIGGGASASLTARDPRLQRKPKPNVATNPEAESNHNFPNQNAPPPLTPAFLSSPVKKSTQLLKPQQNVESNFQASQIHAGIKRTSPNSAQSPNPTEVKKLKFSNANLLNKPGNNEDNNESMKPKPKKILLPPPSAQLQQHPQQNMVQEHVKSTSSNKSMTLQTTVTSKSLINKANDINESALNKSPKQKQ
jgi:hypothetical protein